MSSKVKKIIGIVVIIVLGFIGYRFFFVSEPEPALESQNVSNQSVGRELLTLLSTLQSLELDGEVLEDPDFLSLEDFSVSVSENPLGRRNPFAPIGVGNILGTADFNQDDFEEESETEEEAEAPPTTAPETSDTPDTPETPETEPDETAE